MSSTINERLIPAVQYVTPTTGSTVVANTNGYTKLLVDPSGSLVALTVTFPSSPQDGDIFEICSSQIITTLTMNGGTIVGALTTAALGAFAGYIFNSTANKWFRFQ